MVNSHAASTSPEAASNGESGFATIELALAASTIVIGLLSYVGAIISSTRMSADTRARIAANVEITTAIEEFREAIASDFVTATAALEEKQSYDGITNSDSLRVHRQVILDETKIQPPLDLNGDGDTTDTNLSASDLQAAYLVTTVTWIGPRGQQTITWPSVIARGEVDQEWHRKHVREDDDSEAEEAAVSLSATKATADGGSVAFGFEVSGVASSLHVVGVTVLSDVPAAITEMTVNGTRSFYQPGQAVAVGQWIETETFSLTPGDNSIEGLQFVACDEWDTGVDLDNETITVVFHTETSETFSVEVEVEQ